MMAEVDRVLLARLVDDYDRTAEESLGMGDPDFHEIEDKLYDAIVDSPYRAVIKNGDVYLTDPIGLPGEVILVDPATQEDLEDPISSTLTRSRKFGACGIETTGKDLLISSTNNSVPVLWGM
jgi:hypothetical protein